VRDSHGSPQSVQSPNPVGQYDLVVGHAVRSRTVPDARVLHGKDDARGPAREAAPGCVPGDASSITFRPGCHKPVIAVPSTVWGGRMGEFRLYYDSDLS